MRKLWIGFALVLGVLALLTLGAAIVLKPLATAAEPLFTIEEDIEIDANVDRVWAVLTDFASYPEWNPYALRLEGKLAVGETLTLTIVQDDWAEPLTVYPKLARLEAPRTVGWHGSLVLDGLHETDHYFELEPLAGGRTRLHHAEEFRGWLPERMDSEQMRAATHKAFRAMNEALAKRAEAAR